MRPRTRHGILLALCCLLLASCGAPGWKSPVPASEVDFTATSRSETRGELTVTVAVPNREQTEQLFGTSLYASRIQPVWIRVENRGSRAWMLMKPAVDENAYSPLEAAYQRRSGSEDTRMDMYRFFDRQAFHNPVQAARVTEGYVFTNLDEGVKAVNVDLVADGEMQSFTFVVRVAGLVTDIDQLDLDALYPQAIELADEEALRQAMLELPCCTRNRDDDTNGDPLNLVLVGDRQDIFAALIRRGWHMTEITHAASAWKTVKSFLFGSRYRYSPISALYVYGRPQDLGLQKARESIHLRNHMRLWMTPYRFQGKDVYIGQISRDVGVKLNWPTITTHAIDPDVDDTRDGLVGDLAYSQAMYRIGYLPGSQVSTLDQLSYNLTPDPYISDGLRAVMFFSERPTRLDQIELADWPDNPLRDALRPDIAGRDMPSPLPSQGSQRSTSH